MCQVFKTKSKATNTVNFAKKLIITLIILDGEIPGPYVTEIQKIETEPTQTISNNVEIHKKHDQFDQEVIVEYLPFENTEERAVAKTTKKRSRDEQRKKKRLSMESLKSNGSDISERMETIDEPGIDVKPGETVKSEKTTDSKEADKTTLPEEIEGKEEAKQVSPKEIPPKQTKHEEQLEGKIFE
uniref:Uncharacterized protein n=1 Tax=Panagrolaimus davidi TaxID=227884 RepID=A0A914PP24_9BILA